MKLGSGAYQGSYSFGTRFEETPGSNPEELIAAAHAGCFSMAFSNGLAQAGFTPTRVHTTAKVHLDRLEAGGFGITQIELDTEGEVPGIDEAKFKELAETAKQNCPVSKALGAIPDIRVSAKLVS
jgi:lipoyl-dependent peroxiredoxin